MEGSSNGSVPPQQQGTPESTMPGSTFGLGGPPLKGSSKPTAPQPWNSKPGASGVPPQQSSFNPASSQPWNSRTDAKPLAPTPWNKKPPVPLNSKPADLPQGTASAVPSATSTGSASISPPTEKQVNPRVPSEFSYLDDLEDIRNQSPGSQSTLPASEGPTTSQASLTAGGPKGVKGVNSGLPNTANGQFGPGLPASTKGPRDSLFGPAWAAGPINTAGPGSTKASSEGIRDSRFGPETTNPPSGDGPVYPLSSRFGGSTPSQRPPPSFPPSVAPINSNQSGRRFDIPGTMKPQSAMDVPDEFLDDGDEGRSGRDRILSEGNNKPYVNRDRFSFSDEATMRELAKEREKGIERGDLSKFQDDLKKFMSVAAIGLGAPLTVYLLSALLMTNNVTDQFEKAATYLPGAANFSNPLTSIKLPEVPGASSSKQNALVDPQDSQSPWKAPFPSEDFSLDRISPTLQAPLEKLKEITPDIKARIGAIRMPSFTNPLGPGLKFPTDKMDLSPDLKAQLDKLVLPPGVQMNLEKLEEKIDQNLEKLGEKIEEKFGGITPDVKAQIDKIDQKLEEMMRPDTIDPEEMTPEVKAPVGNTIDQNLEEMTPDVNSELQRIDLDSLPSKDVTAESNAKNEAVESPSEQASGEDAKENAGSLKNALPGWFEGMSRPPADSEQKDDVAPGNSKGGTMDPSVSIAPKEIDTSGIPSASEFVQEPEAATQGATLQQPEVEVPAISQPEVASSKGTSFGDKVDEPGTKVDEAPDARVNLQEEIKNKEEPLLGKGEATQPVAVSTSEDHLTMDDKLDQKTTMVDAPVKVDMKKAQVIIDAEILPPEKPQTTTEVEPKEVKKELAKTEEVTNVRAPIEAAKPETMKEATAESPKVTLTLETPTMQELELEKPEQRQDPAGMEKMMREELKTLEMRMQALLADVKGPDEATQAKEQVQLGSEEQLTVDASSVAARDLSSQKVSKTEMTKDSVVAKMADVSSSTAIGSGGVALFPEGGDVKPPKPAFISLKSIAEATKEEDAGAVSIREPEEEPRIVANVNEIRAKGGAAVAKSDEPLGLDPELVASAKEEKSTIVEGLKLNLQDLEQIQEQPGEVEPSPVRWSIFGGFESKEAFDEAMAKKREKEQIGQPRRSIFGEMNNNRQQMDDNSLF
jgi:hypothetical protein